MLPKTIEIMSTIQQKFDIALNHIEMLYPPDSQYEDTRVIGKGLMDNTVGNSVGYSNWRNLPFGQMIELAKANLMEAGEEQLISELL